MVKIQTLHLPRSRQEHQRSIICLRRHEDIDTSENEKLTAKLELLEVI
ncbi:hypothetical protein HanPSC8_Chr11g0456961 [Helianthus annuus]|nr:hypothetical protein HanPSC8_Chr11g0456961 [Helianthus annuus]